MSLRIDSKEIPKRFKSVALTAALRNLGRIPDQLADIGKILTTEIKRNLSGRILQRRTGALHNSWGWEISTASAGWRLAIGSDVAYARIHELGGWTGKGHRTKIKKSRYVSRAVITQKTHVRRVLRDYTMRMFRG